VTPARRAVLERVARAVLELPAANILQVAIDGVDGAGKTMFADELAEVLSPSGRPLIRAGVDAFHHPKPVRYRLGRHSPEGFYRDSYDYTALCRLLLDPLGPGGSGRFRRAIFDVDADLTVESPEEQAAPGSILLFDGIFLHRPEHPQQASLRYSEGQAMYLRQCRPAERASMLIDNDDLAGPFIVRPP